MEKFKERVCSLTIRSHNLDQAVIRGLNRVITGFAHYFATPLSTVKEQFFDFDAWTRMCLRCIKFKRISRGDNRRFSNKRFPRMGLVSLYSFTWRIAPIETMGRERQPLSLTHWRTSKGNLKFQVLEKERTQCQFASHPLNGKER
jgi:hypothetical protein